MNEPLQNEINDLLLVAEYGPIVGLRAIVSTDPRKGVLTTVSRYLQENEYPDSDIKIALCRYFRDKFRTTGRTRDDIVAELFEKAHVWRLLAQDTIGTEKYSCNYGFQNNESTEIVAEYLSAMSKCADFMPGDQLINGFAHRIVRSQKRKGTVVDLARALTVLKYVAHTARVLMLS